VIAHAAYFLAGICVGVGLMLVVLVQIEKSLL
jgi:hypothetical protein